jgi:hypothetical protein
MHEMFAVAHDLHLEMASTRRKAFDLERAASLSAIMRMGWSDKDLAGCLHCLGELWVFGQKPVAGMYGPGTLRRAAATIASILR